MARGGPAPANTYTSAARALDPSDFDGMRHRDIARSRQLMRMEQEILRAAQALHSPVLEPLPPGMNPPQRPGTVRPRIPNPTVPTTAARPWSTMNPLLAAIELLLYAGEVNAGEGQALAQKRNQPATITPSERKGK